MLQCAAGNVAGILLLNMTHLFKLTSNLMCCSVQHAALLAYIYLTHTHTHTHTHLSHMTHTSGLTSQSHVLQFAAGNLAGIFLFSMTHLFVSTSNLMCCSVRRAALLAVHAVKNRFAHRQYHTRWVCLCACVCEREYVCVYICVRVCDASEETRKLFCASSVSHKLGVIVRVCKREREYVLMYIRVRVYDSVDQ